MSDLRERFASFCTVEPKFYSLTGFISVEGHQPGAGFDVVPLAGEGTGPDIVDPSLDLKSWRGKREALGWIKTRCTTAGLREHNRTKVMYFDCFIKVQWNSTND